jgi:hypothetical protein
LLCYRVTVWREDESAPHRLSAVGGPPFDESRWAADRVHGESNQLAGDQVVELIAPNGLVKVSIDDADKRAVDWQRDFTEALMANTRDSPASRRRLSQPSPSK